MNQELLIVGIIALAVGAIITYLILKSSMVNRNKFDELKDNFAATKN